MEVNLHVDDYDDDDDDDDDAYEGSLLNLFAFIVKNSSYLNSFYTNAISPVIFHMTKSLNIVHQAI